MDRTEFLVARKRIARWPKEWREIVTKLPVNEARVLVELAALLDARPDETGQTE